MKDNKKNITDILCKKIKDAIEKIKPSEFDMIQEIRLRPDRPLCLSIRGNIMFLSPEGNIISDIKSALTINIYDIETTFKIICQYSLHSFQKELSQGYITIKGGNRVGLSGTSVTKFGQVETIKDISCINIRIAKEIIGCADDIYSHYFHSDITSMLIAGPPSCGKTTVLRDLCRIIGNYNNISIIDERNEIAAVYNGQPQNSIGICSDVFNGYPRNAAIMIALRTMSPKFIICDEIGNEEDTDALMNVMNCGVKIIATAHCDTIENLIKRKALIKLFDNNVFENIILLGSGIYTGKVIDTKRLVKTYA